MYKILIVDDEELIRRGLKYAIKWEEMGFQVTDEADNSEDALEKLERNNFDVVITDIRMPGIDGLEMTKLLKQKYPSVKVVIISGYNEFDYAVSAIQLKVENYVLKPIRKEKIKEVFKKLKEELDKENDTFVKIRESTTLAKEHVLSRLISNDYQNIEEIIEILNSLEIVLTDSDYCIVALKINNIEEYISRFFQGRSNFLKNAFVSEFSQYLVTTIHSNFVILVPYEQTVEVLNTIKEFLNKKMQLEVKVSYKIGIGKRYSSLDYMPISYNEAIEALNSNQGENITFYGDLTEKKNDDAYKKVYAQKQLISAIESSQVNKVNELIDILFVDFQKADINTAYNWCLNTIYSLLKYFNVNEIHNFKVVNNLDITEIFFHKNFKAVKLWFKENLMSIIGILKQIASEPVVSLVTNAQNIIQNEYYKKEISLADVAKRLNVSSGYLCTVFKQVTGVNFTTFLTDVRMENARRLILDSSYKVYEIAYKLGYSSPRYFTDTFRKYFGVSPSDYKSRLGGSQCEN